MQVGDSVCSGVYVKPNVYLTAAHCLHDKVPKQISLAGKVANVVSVTLDETDHALIVVDIKSDHFAPVSTFEPKVGDQIFYVGNPGGLDQILRKGYVSGYLGEDILMDVRGWKGDSGAGIFNSAGYLIGTMNYYWAPHAEGNLFYMMGFQRWSFKAADLKAIGYDCVSLPVCSK